MDPNAALEGLRELAKEAQAEIDGDNDPEVLAECAAEFIDLFEGLDDWLKRGGFLPADWKSDR